MRCNQINPFKIFILAIPSSAMLFSTSLFSYQDKKTGYYLSGKLLSSELSLENMGTSLRPGIGSFIEGEDTDNFISGSFALGYQFKNSWRAEVEYTLKNESTFTSGSSAFPTSFNNHIVESQRVMVNLYKDLNISKEFSLFGTVGLGITNVNSSGWQGNPSRQYDSNEQNNLTYSLGAGISYTPIDSFSLDLGYRYIDMGKIESGFNNFANVRNSQDEQMRGDLISSEVFLGARIKF